jgi:hypothetical protein
MVCIADDETMPEAILASPEVLFLSLAPLVLIRSIILYLGSVKIRNKTCLTSLSAPFLNSDRGKTKQYTYRIITDEVNPARIALHTALVFSSMLVSKQEYQKY